MYRALKEALSEDIPSDLTCFFTHNYSPVTA